MDNKIPITIITGFLGSGKTTLLKRLISQNEGRKILYLINDFSAHDVDGELIQKDGISLKSVTGGSVFCSCKITEFVEVLKSAADSELQFEEIIIEASGIANPLTAKTMLNESGLDNKFSINQVICILDPTNFILLKDSLPNIENQVKSANLVIINKADLVDVKQEEEIRQTVKTMNSVAKIITSNFCEFDLNLLAAPSNLNNSTSVQVDRSVFSSYSIKSKRDLNLIELQSFVVQHKMIFRIKGFIKIEGVMHYLSYSGSGWEVIPTSYNKTSHLEIIYQKDAPINFRGLAKILFSNK